MSDLTTTADAVSTTAAYQQLQAKMQQAYREQRAVTYRLASRQQPDRVRRQTIRAEEEYAASVALGSLGAPRSVQAASPGPRP